MELWSEPWGEAGKYMRYCGRFLRLMMLNTVNLLFPIMRWLLSYIEGSNDDSFLYPDLSWKHHFSPLPPLLSILARRLRFRRWKSLWFWSSHETYTILDSLSRIYKCLLFILQAKILEPVHLGDALLSTAVTFFSVSVQNTFGNRKGCKVCLLRVAKFP